MRNSATATAPLPRLNGSITNPGLDLATSRVHDVSRLTFRALYEEHKSRVYGVVTGVVGRTDELDDIVQQVFLEIHRSLPRYRGGAKLSTWIYRIAVNVALQHIRKRKRRKVFLFFDPDESRAEPVGEHPQGRYESRDVLEKLQVHLGKLSEKKRVVFVLHELEGLPLERVADICDVPVNTVRSRLHAARTEVTSRLKRAGMLEAPK